VVTPPNREASRVIAAGVTIARAAGWTVLIGLPVGLLIGLIVYVGHLEALMRPGGPALRQQAEHVADVAEDHPAVRWAGATTAGSTGYLVDVRLAADATPEAVRAAVHDVAVAVLDGDPGYSGTVTFSAGSGATSSTFRLTGRTAVATADAQALAWTGSPAAPTPPTAGPVTGPSR
jgi:hypothetical protein